MTRRRVAAIGATGAALLAAFSANFSGPVNAAPTPTGWQPVFVDDFDAPAGTAPDSSTWGYDLGGGGWGNAELQTYTDSTRNAATDGQGNLVITARQENTNGAQCWYGACSHTSARLLSKGKLTQQYGRIEARVKVPTGNGLWPAFWMLGADFDQAGWPASGEIDIMEILGKDPGTAYGTIHGPGYSGGGGPSASTTLPGGASFADDFHTFTIDWAPDSIKWYVDGNLYSTKTPADIGGNQWVFNKEFFLILNLAVGGNWPGSPDASTGFPAEMVVDYVATYQADQGQPPPTPDPTTPPTPDPTVPPTTVPPTPDPTVPPTPDPTPPAAGSALVSNWHNKCIDVPNWSFNDGQRLITWDCTSGTNQRWEFVNGTVRTANNMCMDVAWGSTADGTAIQIATCNGNPAQQFVLSEAGDLVNPQANKCVDITDWNPDNDALLQLWTCTGTANQKWRQG